MNDRHTGTLKFFKEDKRFGFITRDDGQGDDFVHATAFIAAGIALTEIHQGMRLTYVLKMEKGRTAAVEIRKAA